MEVGSEAQLDPIKQRSYRTGKSRCLGGAVGVQLSEQERWPKQSLAHFSGKSYAGQSLPQNKDRAQSHCRARHEPHRSGDRGQQTVP